MIKFDLTHVILYFQDIAVMSDTKPKLINHNETKQPSSSITRLNELESSEKRKEILNGKKQMFILINFM